MLSSSFGFRHRLLAMGTAISHAESQTMFFSFVIRAWERSGILRFASTCLLCASLGSAGQTAKPAQKQDAPAKSPQIDTSQPYVPVQTDSHPCSNSDWGLLTLESTRSLLADYGFDVLAPIA